VTNTGRPPGATRSSPALHPAEGELGHPGPVEGKLKDLRPDHASPPGEKKTVTFTLTAEKLAYWNAA